MRRILILGATSSIALETARFFAADGDQFFLVGRDAERLGSVQYDLKTRGASAVGNLAVDLSDVSTHESVWREAQAKLGNVDIVLVAYGSLGSQSGAEKSYDIALQELQVNFLSVVSLLTLVANTFEQKQAGHIVVISSVAGDRGRQSNYVYGTAKGALSIFLQGLRNRLYRSGVGVTTVKPGFVDTPMTRDIKKGLLFASARTVGQGIYKATLARKDVVYLPWFWCGIMLIIKMIPERVFKRLRL